MLKKIKAADWNEIFTNALLLGFVIFVFIIAILLLEDSKQRKADWESKCSQFAELVEEKQESVAISYDRVDGGKGGDDYCNVILANGESVQASKDQLDDIFD